ncbi:MAG: thiamine phosphate synthase [Candidatus Aminicenantes bacterium]
MNIDWRLCLVADVDAACGRNLVAVVEEAVQAGVTCVQLRAKHLDGGLFLALANNLAEILLPQKIPLFINDRVDVAASCRCQGVHLGQNDLPVPQARRILGEKSIIGISINTVQEAKRASQTGADYLGAGPVFQTRSKSTSYPVLGQKGLRTIRNAVDLPILAIGGISPDNAAQVFEAGADGIAVISAILGHGDIKEATGKLVRVLPHRPAFSET